MLSLGKMVLYAFFLGVGFGFLYDVFRITRVVVGVEYLGVAKKSTDYLYSRTYPLIGKIERRENKAKKYFLDIFVGVGDIIYCLLVGVAFCIFLYYSNDGIFRWHSLAAAVCGFFVYYKTLGAILITFAEIICIFLKIISKILLFAIAFPFKFMYNIIISILKFLFRPISKAFVLRYRRIVTQHKMKILLVKAKSGFLEKI